MTRETLTNESVQEAQALIQQASQAQATLKTFSQKQIDTIVKSMADAALRESIRLAQMAADETGFGNAADKVVKNEFASKNFTNTLKTRKPLEC